jgi:hypothetical protein
MNKLDAIIDALESVFVTKFRTAVAYMAIGAAVGIALIKYGT